MPSKSHVGSIDLLKFILAIVIVVLHCGQTYGGEDYALRMGGIAVEAFFVISGYLMCDSARRAGRWDECGGDSVPGSGSPASESAVPALSVGEATVRFLRKKVSGFLLPYLVIIVIYLFCWYRNTGCAILSSEGPDVFLLRLLSFVPNLMLLSMAGILQDKTLMDITWYLSAMLLSMLVIYPLVRTFRHSYTLIAAPFVAVTLMGYMYNVGNIYKGTSYFLTFAPQGLLRAFIAVNLGCVSWELSGCLRGLRLTRLSRWLLAGAVAAMLGVMFLVMQCGEEKDCYPLVLLYPFLVAILFSRQMAGDRLLCNRVSTFLGRSSLYLYLYHVAVRKLLMTARIDLTYPRSLVVILGGAFAMFLATELLRHLFRKLLTDRGIRISSLFLK